MLQSEARDVEDLNEVKREASGMARPLQEIVVQPAIELVVHN
jgi:hypothetical protein